MPRAAPPHGAFAAFAAFAFCCVGAVLAALAVTGLGPVHAGDSNAKAEAEIGMLLARLRESPCQFNRNGTWYSGKEASLHLGRKRLQGTAAGTPVSPEQFVALTASRSSDTGVAYVVRCPGVPEVSAAEWWFQHLAAMRRQPAR